MRCIAHPSCVHPTTVFGIVTFHVGLVPLFVDFRDGLFLRFTQ